MSAPSGNRLPALAAEIAEAHARCGASTVDAIRAAVEAGRRLLEAKALVGHGEWVPWLAANVPGVSARTAQRYMRAAKNAGENDTVSFFSLRELIRPKRQKPDPERAECRHEFASIAAVYDHREGTTVVCRCGHATFLTLREVLPGALFVRCDELDPDRFERTIERTRGAALDMVAEVLAAAADAICDLGDGVFETNGYRWPLREVRRGLTPEGWRDWLVREFSPERLDEDPERVEEPAEPVPGVVASAGPRRRRNRTAPA